MDTTYTGHHKGGRRSAEGVGGEDKSGEGSDGSRVGEDKGGRGSAEGVGGEDKSGCVCDEDDMA